MSKLYISAGHGGSDSGACANGKREKDYTLNVANAVSGLLREAGHTVIQNRTTDVDSFISDKTAKANAEKVDAFVEIHLNSGGGVGTEVYYSISGRGKALAEAILNNIVSLGFTNRGIKTKRGIKCPNQDYFGIIRQVSCPSVLVETAFIDSASDMAKYDVSKMANAVAKGILSQYPAIAKPAPAPAPSPAQSNGQYKLLQAMRFRDSIDGSAIGNIPKNTLLTPIKLERSARGTLWAQHSYGGRTGWTAVDPAKGFAEKIGTVIRYKLKQSMSLRVIPDGFKLANIPTGTIITPIKTTKSLRGTLWAQCTYGGRKGYVAVDTAKGYATKI